MKRCPMRSHDTCAAKQEMGVIPEADNQMLQWTKEVLGEAIASLNPPAKEQQGRGFGIYLLEVAAEPRANTSLRVLDCSLGSSIWSLPGLIRPMRRTVSLASCSNRRCSIQILRFM